MVKSSAYSIAGICQPLSL